MIGRTNAAATAKTSTFAFIRVTYPAGSTCTANNGLKAFQAPDTSGLWVINVATPKVLPQTWTITATDGSNTKSETVTIATEGQNEELLLSYKLVLFDGSSGGDITDISGGWGFATQGGAGGNLQVSAAAINGTSTGYSITNRNHVFWSNKKAINVTNYSTLWFELASYNVESECQVGLTDSPNGSLVASLGIYRSAYAQTIHTVDISDVTGDKFVGGHLASNESPTTISITKIWLE